MLVAHSATVQGEPIVIFPMFRWNEFGQRIVKTFAMSVVWRGLVPQATSSGE